MKSLKLISIYHNELDRAQSYSITGGGTAGNCGCGCNGSSSTCDNARANYNTGSHSSGTKPVTCPGDHSFNTFAFALGLNCQCATFSDDGLK